MPKAVKKVGRPKKVAKRVGKVAKKMRKQKGDGFLDTLGSTIKIFGTLLPLIAMV